MEPKLTILENAAEKGGKRIQVEMQMVSEFRGAYPDIKLPEDVDIPSLGENVQFVTLPLGQVDSRSRNGRNYPRKVVESLMKQINDRRPEGMWGHVPTELIGTAYSPPAIRWLKAEMDADGILWAKGLPLTADSDNYYRKARSTNAKVGTSLMAWAEMDGEDVTDADLITVDMADPARVGIPITAAKPHLSSEMIEGQDDKPTPTDPPPVIEQAATQPNSTNSPKSEDTMTLDVKDQEISELTIKNATLKTTNAEMETQLRALKPVQEDHKDIRELLGVAADGDLVKSVKAVLEQRNELAQEATRLLAETMTAIIAEKVKLPGVRPIVTDLVKAQNPVTRKQLDAAIDGVLASESVKTLLAAGLQETMGDKQRRPLTPGSHDETWKQFVAIPERK